MQYLIRSLLFISIMIFFQGALRAQSPAVTTANYSLAERFSPSRLDKMVFDTRVTPHWLPSRNCFWYTYKTSEGTFYYLVEPDKKTKKNLFDNQEMAAMLTLITKDAYDGQHLPTITPKFKETDTAFQFDLTSPATRKTYHLEYNLKTARLSEYTVARDKKPVLLGLYNLSPDSGYAVYAKGYNLFYMDKANYMKVLNNSPRASVVEHQLTRDGSEDYPYGNNIEMERPDSGAAVLPQYPQPAKILWSPDSKKFALLRKDTRKIKPMWVINSLSSPRPTLYTYKYQLPGEVDPTEMELLVFTIASKKIDTIDVKKFTNQKLGLPERVVTTRERTGVTGPDIWLSENPNELYFSRQSRDLHLYDFCSVNLETNKVRVLIEEKMNSYVEVNTPILIHGGKEMIHLSERDGWAHFYLYDNQGNLKRQLTAGAWHCSYDGYAVDEKSGWLYFNGNGHEASEDPYYKHFYKVKLDGTGLTLLNKDNYNHQASLDETQHYFVDNYSRVNTAPKSALRDINGNLVLDLETADLSNLVAAGYKYPEPFKVKADDGVTDIYGVMYKPFDFDSTKSYPVIEYVYPGPQSEHVNKSFSTSMDVTDRLAQLGFVVITLGNRGGSPERSRWYHTYGYGDLRDYGLADKKYAIEQLAVRHKYIDINRVGIFGHSGGGFMSTAALCQYPDFYKVAISSSGNHDNNIYNLPFTEKYNGIKEQPNDKEGPAKFLYEVETNPQIAANLKGHLLLITGDVDYNVNPANTLRMANALIKANKRFDMFILPGQSHNYRNESAEYWFWLISDYFSKHLLGDAIRPVDIPELNRAAMKTPDKKAAN
ncbi:Dipeptidyl aminopeptidase/acylaminoacyl peptidase [Niastella yeongjuensis]|nr:Dipeptidyl aminopeptidase/acylaminoacyl peptidase [Niastella yeongjuensis]